MSRHEIRPCDSHCSRRASSLHCFSLADERLPCGTRKIDRSDQNAAQSATEPGDAPALKSNRGSHHTAAPLTYPLLLGVARRGRCGRGGAVVSHPLGGDPAAGCLLCGVRACVRGMGEGKNPRKRRGGERERRGGG